MSDLIIKIGDDALDLAEDQVIAITKQAAKVGDFSAILADGTNEVTIPLTPNNKTILDNAHLIESDSNKPYGRLDATLIQEGYQTIQDGYAIVKSSKNDFSLQVIGGNASFFELIKDLELRDLPLSDYDHFWTNEEVFDLRNESEGLIYAVFEQSVDDNTMRTYSPTPNDRFAVHTALLLPSYYVKTLVEKIFEEQGYTFVTDLSTENIYTKAGVFNGGDYISRGDDMTYHECTIVNDTDQVVQATNPDSFRYFDEASVQAPTNSYTSGDPFVDALQEAGGKKFGVTDNCTLTLTVDLEIENPGSIKDTYFKVEHTTENGIVNTQIALEPILGATHTYTFSVEIEVHEFGGENYFTPYLEYVTPTLEALIIKAGSTYTVSDVVLDSNTNLSITFPFNYVKGFMPIPEMKQGEFLKELARVYQWIYDTDERTKTVTARRFDEIKDNIPDAIDLSDKLHVEDIQINYGLDGFAQTNELRYQEDDETKYDAVGYIDVSDTTLKAEKEYVSMSEFAASSTRTRFENVAAPYIPVFEEEEPANQLNDRLLLFRRIDAFDENVNFFRAGSTPNENIPTDDLTFAYFAEAGNEDSLDFPTLIDRFYQTIVDMNDKGKTVECMMNLNIKDVQNYDPFKPVYISHFGNYFYWEKVSNYVKDKLTKCIFVKL